MITEETSTPEIVITESLTEPQSKSNFKTATDAGRKGLEVTGQFMTKVLDVADYIDRFLYGYRLKLFVGLSLFVVVIAPIIDWLRNDWRDTWTARSTVILFILLVVLLFAWVGSLRDDEGKWSFKRVRNRIWTYLMINIDYLKDTIGMPQEEMVYRLCTISIIGSFCWKAMQNISVFTRKLFHIHWKAMNSFERTTNTWSFWLFILGVALLIYLLNKDKNKTLDNLSKDFFAFSKHNKTTKTEALIAETKAENLIFNTRDKAQINEILISDNSKLFNDFILSLQKWTPRDCESEDDFQNHLHRQLKRNLPHATIEREYRLVTDETNRRKDRKADIVINEEILIEMKSNFQATATDRATGQVWNYAKLWGNRGPVILLLCDADYEHAKKAFNSQLTDIAKIDKKIIAFVKPK